MEIMHLLPESVVGTVTAIQPIRMGLSGAGVYAVSTSLGELVLRVQGERGDTAQWTQQLRVIRRAAERGVAPEIVHVDEAGRAIVSRRVAGLPLAAVLGDPVQRRAALASVVGQLRELHELDATGVQERDPLALGRAELAAQRVRAGFPAWATALEPAFATIETILARDPRRVVSHNDVNPSNILWDGTRAWLVDWEVSGLAHPFYDLATLAMFLLLDDATLVSLEPELGEAAARATFAALRRLAAILCGLVLLGLVPDLTELPTTALALPAFYAELRAGTIDLQTTRGQGAFALALLKLA